MKNLYLSALLLAFPFILLAQNIHGLWSGTLVNDSTHRTQNFELGLSEYRGKITGYTYTTFIENDTFYYSVKRIKAERKDGKLVIEDVEMVGNNFPERAAKRVKQITTFPLINDTTIDITRGHWSTNQTKKYYSIAGSATIKEQEEEKESDLLAHLQEMKVKNDIAINKKEKKKENSVVKNSSPALKKNNNEKIPEKKSVDVAKSSTATNTQQNNNGDKIPEAKNDIAKNSQPQPSEIKTAAEVKNTQKTDDKKADIASNDNTEIKNNDLNKTKPSTADNKNTTIVSNNNTENEDYLNPNTTLRQKQAVSITPAQRNIPANSNIETKTINTAVSVNKPQIQNKETIKGLKELPAIVAERKNETMQDIYFKNDSLVLSLYDNGIVDGDTVSVFLNGENIVSKQKLKEAATKKTIYISSRTDSVELVLFAENLGTIPPNTGLLTVRDGDEVYQVRFSADLQKNASLFLRRKKDQ
jgi:hypothetical protein